MKYKKLRAKMVECELTQAALAPKIGITVQSLNKKLNGRNQFTLAELKAICIILGIPPSDISIFFDLGA